MISLGLLGLPGTILHAQDSPPPEASTVPPRTAPSAGPTEIQIGQPVRSTIDEQDPQEDNRYYEEYILTLAKDDVIRVEMEADRNTPPLNPDGRPIDTYLEILPQGNRAGGVRNDDRGIGDLNSRIIFTAPESGLYVIRAQGFYRHRGAYVLTVSSLGRAVPPRLLERDRGTGRFGPDSAVGEEGGQAFRYIDYSFSGARDERVRLRLDAGEAEGRLELRAPDRSVLVQDIGLGGDSMADLFAVLPEAGTYTVRARAPSDAEVDYVLELTRGRAARPDEVLRLTLDREESSTLTIDSPIRRPPDRARIFYFYQDYELVVQSGQPVTIELNADSFDPILEAGVMSPIGFAMAMQNDDTNGLNSQLVLRPDRTGVVRVRVRSLGPAVGAYTLTATAGLPRPRQPQQPSAE